MSEGLRRAGFDVTGVDNRDLSRHYRGGTFVQADALTYSLDGFDFVHASPPCQAHSSLRHLHPGREYPDLIEPMRERLKAWGGPFSIENVPGAPLGGSYLVVLCGTMFGLATPDGRAVIRRHRLFELNFCPDRQPPPCRHPRNRDNRQGLLFCEEPEGETLAVAGSHGLPGRGARERAREESLSVTGNGLDSNRERWAHRRSLSVTGHSYHTVETHPDRTICVAGGKAMSGGMSEPQGMRKRRAMSVTGSTPQTNVERNISRETFTVDDARAAMGIAWMSMKYLSQAIPPAYGQFIGERALAHLAGKQPPADSTGSGL